MKYLSAKDAAEWFRNRGLHMGSRSNLTALRKRGEGPVHYLYANRVYYREEDLQAWVETLRNDPGMEKKTPRTKGGKPRNNSSVTAGGNV